MVTFTPRLLEADVFPSVLFPARSVYVSYTQAQKAWGLVRRNQPWDPKNPSEGIARLLRADVAWELLGPDQSWDDVRLYTAVGSALDWHRIDGWIEYRGSQVQLDYTANPAKLLEEWYGDSLLLPPTLEEPLVRAKLAAVIADELRQGMAARARPR